MPAPAPTLWSSASACVCVCVCLCLQLMCLVMPWSACFVNSADVEEPNVESYPAYGVVPEGLRFSCAGHAAGYYADPDTRCQVWHWCLPSGQQFSFLCPNGTVFNQAFRVCDWWFNVDCGASASLYSVNDDLYRTGL